VQAGGREYTGNAVISTVPIPLVNNLIPDLPQDWKDKYAPSATSVSSSFCSSCENR
jgi:hypothetical protein